MYDRLRLWLAMASSEMMSKTEGDQLRMIVWSRSRTFERPLRSSSSLPSMADDSTPMRVEKMKMPATVIASAMMRKPQPLSPPIVPASMERISAAQAASIKSSGSLPFGAIAVTAMTMAAKMMTRSEISPSQPIRATGPEAMDLSNR